MKCEKETKKLMAMLVETIPQQEVFFKETSLELGTGSPAGEAFVLNVFDEIEYQEVLGFGGAFTESAAYNYSLLDEEQKKEFIKKYFDKKEGIGYSIGRTHINSCDFSLDAYTYVEEGDMTLKTFSIERDRQYIIPFLKDALAYCQEEIFLFASPWSPPAYMKDSQSVLLGGSLKEEYKALWALYYAKYIKAYREEGIDISALTIQNEPIARQTWESCNYTAEQERDFLEKYLIPTLDKEGLSDIKIIIWDHNKERIYDRSKVIFENEEVKERVYAVGYHWYSGEHFDGLSLVQEQFQKPTICTEFCWIITADALTLAERYGKEISEHFNHYTIASCDWNLLLNQDGGPHHDRVPANLTGEEAELMRKKKGCYAPILYNNEKKELIYTPIYYYIGHFSKYVQRGARRIAVTKFTTDLSMVAFKNPDGTIVVVIMNATDEDMNFSLRFRGEQTPIEMKAHSIITVII